MTAAQVERYFDNWVLVQAQTALRLDDRQFLTFGRRLERLQALRRQHQQQRRQVLDELREMTRPEAVLDEAAIGAKLKALDDLAAQHALELRQVYQAVDQVLGPRQRAWFRIFEEQMERRKVDLLLRARQQAGRGAGRAPNAEPAPDGRQ